MNARSASRAQELEDRGVHRLRHQRLLKLVHGMVVREFMNIEHDPAQRFVALVAIGAK
jgi:hypothetical protein